MSTARNEAKPNNVMLGFDSMFESGDYKGMTVRSVLSIGRKSILFRLISMGYQFDDDVLAYARIKKVVRPCEGKLSVVEHLGDVANEKLGVDIGTVDDIVDELGNEVPEIDEDTIPVDDSDDAEDKKDAQDKKADKYDGVEEEEEENEAEDELWVDEEELIVPPFLDLENYDENLEY